MSLAPRAVVVHRRSELDLLLERHGTRGQAEFFLRSRGRDLAAVQNRHDALAEALHQVDSAIPGGWRRSAVEREDLPRLRFDPEDVVLAVGQDGLVANVAKYVADQPVIGVDPEPGVNPGVLVRHSPASVAAVLVAVVAGTVPRERRCMVEAALDDGQVLRALNELYLGDPGHQSARYRLLAPQLPVDGVGGDDVDRATPSGPAGPAGPAGPTSSGERQSSSGVVIGTGTGATGWCASLAHDRARPPALPGPLDESLAWFVREAWPSPFTGTTRTEGLLQPGEALRVIAEGDLVVFGDGLESDRLRVGWGQQITVRVASSHLSLV
jgi:NAD kinase